MAARVSYGHVICGNVFGIKRLLMRKRRLYPAILVIAALSACAQDPDAANRAALEIGAPRMDAGAIRARQTAVFENVSEERLLIESTHG